MFSVTIRDHMMVAHSLERAVFGPAQRLHGPKYVVDATPFRSEALHTMASALSFPRNLDDQPERAL